MRELLRQRAPSLLTKILRWRRLDRWELLLRRVGTLLFRMGIRVAGGAGVVPRQEEERSGFLIVSLSGHVGDTVMLMPLIETLHAMYPGEPMDAAVDVAGEQLLRMVPELRRVYGLRFSPGIPETLGMSSRRVMEVVRGFWREMRGCRPAVCLLPRWGDDVFRSAYLAALTGAGRRIGFASDVGVPRYRGARYRDRLLTEAIGGGHGIHEPMRMLRLLTASGLARSGTPLPRSETTVGALVRIAKQGDWRGIAARIGMREDRPFAVIAPGTTQARKIWPIERWVAVTAELLGSGLEVVVLSGRQDAGIARALHEASGGMTRLAAGVTSLPESVTLLGHAAAFAGSDSGPGHIAGALGVPCAILFIGSREADGDDPFSPERNRPMGPYVGVCQPRCATAPCVGSCEATMAHCILEITLGEVMEALRTQMRRKEQVEGGREEIAMGSGWSGA
jgi:ADP-heptose:LPS heptosyltransferase